MDDKETILSAEFVDLHFVDETYHEQHPQLIHQHEGIIELLYIVKGVGNYIVNNHMYVVQPGSLVICNEGISHGEPTLQSQTLQSYCCVLKNLQVPGLPPNTLCDPSQYPVLLFPQEEKDAERILLTLHSLHTQPEGHNSICNLLANALLNLVYFKLSKRQQTVSTQLKGNQDFIQSITEYLDEHFREPLTLTELGKRFHMSHYYFVRIYKKETGVSPMKYVLHRRIGEAQNLLMNTDMSIGEISDTLGFGDNSHFSSMFKKYVGVTPTQYRDHFQAK